MTKVAEIKGGGFTWRKERANGCNLWVGEVDKGHPPRIKQLDPVTFMCFRDTKYLGSEPDLEAAFARIKANKLSASNSAAKSASWQAPPAAPEVGARATIGALSRAGGALRPAPQLAPSSDGTQRRRGGKADVVPLLLRPEGCTREDILAATGWPSVSVQAVAKSAGLVLRVDKGRKPFRYFATEKEGK